MAGFRTLPTLPTLQQSFVFLRKGALLSRIICQRVMWSCRVLMDSSFAVLLTVVQRLRCLHHVPYGCTFSLSLKKDSNIFVTCHHGRCLSMAFSCWAFS